MDSFDSCYRVNVGLEEDDSLQDLNSLPDLLYQRKFQVVEDGNQYEKEYYEVTNYFIQ